MFQLVQNIVLSHGFMTPIHKGMELCAAGRLQIPVHLSERPVFAVINVKCVKCVKLHYKATD